MELSVALFVLIVVGTAVVGLLVGLFLARLRLGREGPVADPDAGSAAKDSAPKGGAATDRAQSDTADAELTALRAARDELEHRAITAERIAEEHQRRFGDIVGLESENATLRVIAARVPRLEARLAELEATQTNTVIDLRDEITADPA